jgi:hypothetical protein
MTEEETKQKVKEITDRAIPILLDLAKTINEFGLTLRLAAMKRPDDETKIQ